MELTKITGFIKKIIDFGKAREEYNSENASSQQNEVSVNLEFNDSSYFEQLNVTPNQFANDYDRIFKTKDARNHLYTKADEK